MSYAAYVKNINALANIMTLTPEQKIEKLYSYANGYKEGRCQWYWRGIARKRRAAFLLLIMVFALVILATFIQAVVVNYYHGDVGEQFFLSQLAFGLFAMSIVLLLIDKVFGWTSGWVRYIKTVLDVEIIHNDFTSKWIANNSLNEHNFDTCYQNALKLVKDFIQSVDGFQKRETDEWSMQFGDSLNQLGAMLKANQQENSQSSSVQNGNSQQEKWDGMILSGAINIHITTSSSQKMIKVLMKKGTRTINEKEFSAGCWGVTDIAPDIYLLEICDGLNSIHSQAVKICPGEVLRVDFSI
ncbi:SLATT domain-containing protein [Pantoea sp. S18]|uniref:SLATT domain-containing protein n=1 Tax=Pantoea sp. S18 TaxID=3019892 RepID=UPI002B207D71|nr:SLATT domain-containing protein [Pantoea sp. S18]MEA5100899.1 SLATT domain-containing protein [Pantoea sp. S18]